MRGLSAEVCKNIVLAGVKSLTILDHSRVTSEDAANRFLVSKEGEYVSVFEGLCALVVRAILSCVLESPTGQSEATGA